MTPAAAPAGPRECQVRPAGRAGALEAVSADLSHLRLHQTPLPSLTPPPEPTPFTQEAPSVDSLAKNSQPS